MVGLVMLIPGMLITGVLVILVRMTSRGPGIYSQQRVGRGGKVFTLYKIRTMRIDAEVSTGPVWTQDNDPRITPVGRVLRKLHMDEFPQLLNVVRGDMSLIGPRPERPEFTQVLAKEIPGYLDRLAVRPGITGLAQINLPPDSDLDSVRKKLAVDLDYIEKADWYLDARIALCTLFRLCGIGGYRAARMLKLRRKVLLPADSDSGELEVYSARRRPIVQAK
jgi:lipopolysaccharide/colanic/teichoic acid biosynthesis glycosyltransferase